MFAKARCAIEALAVGCAVILCDEAGLGELVLPANLDHCRSFNFGMRTLYRPISADAVREEIARYDASACEQVAQRTRISADLCFQIAQWSSLIEEIRSTFTESIDENAQLAVYFETLVNHMEILEHLPPLRRIARAARRLVVQQWRRFF